MAAAQNAFDAADRLRRHALRTLSETLVKLWTSEHPDGSLADANEYAQLVMADVKKGDDGFTRSIEKTLREARRTMREAR